MHNVLAFRFNYTSNKLECLGQSPNNRKYFNYNNATISLTRKETQKHNTISSSLVTPRNDQYLKTLLDSSRPFLRGEFEAIDEKLPSFVSVGAGECWHKHGNFLGHLMGVYRILKIWGVQNAVCLCGLFHSAYSNSYTNLAIFDPTTGRDVVRGHVGPEAERLIHLFCIVPRQILIHDDLLFKYVDSELVEHLKLSEISVSNAKEKRLFDDDEPWRKKIQSLVPSDGVILKHIKTGEDVRISRRLVAIFLLITMADFSDQFYGFQDILFGNTNGRMEFSGNDWDAGIWPGNGKPGLWMNSVSRMGAIYSLLVREEEIFIQQRMCNSNQSETESIKDRDEELKLVIPPVFNYCTRVLDSEEQIAGRELYWEAVCNGGNEKKEKVEKLLLDSILKNPFAGEPHVVLGQVYAGQGRFEEAEMEAEKGVRLMLEWGSPWDKRVTWEGWIAWARVVLMKSKDKSWPNTSWGILNLGLVK
ncbi:uncharacterized protein LOC124913079 [Impatiens glandulifera]|uniref:uncharacterized protein LOC124913079 n=1 Tax=Impatiens glandulifera TaxID=253017 RepID=UPI001FB1586D|nr:uncharacterized protein LOC124913079 [Impatiens glandulifera]